MREPGSSDQWFTGWKLMDRHADEVVDVSMEGPVPLDVDTWDDYRRVLLAAAGD